MLQGEKGVVVQCTNLHGQTRTPFPPDAPLKKLEAKSLVQPTHSPQNPGCEPCAELIQFRKGIVGVYVANYVLFVVQFYP